MRTIRTRREPQPTRRPVKRAVAKILASDPERMYETRELAQLVYKESRWDPKRPTPAQLSAVRRAVAQLVAEGLVETLPDRRREMMSEWPHSRHERVIAGQARTCLDPRGVPVRWRST